MAGVVREGGVMEKEMVKGGGMMIKGWLLASLRSLALCGVCVGFAGCEGDRESTVVNEAPENEINIPTNGATVATINTTGNQNMTIVYIETTPGMTQVYEVNTIGNSNLLGFFSSGLIVAPSPTTTNAPEPDAP